MLYKENLGLGCIKKKGDANLRLFRSLRGRAAGSKLHTDKKRQSLGGLKKS